MSLRIAFDLDGVLADMESELVRQAEILFGEAMARRLQERTDDRPPGRESERASDVPPPARRAPESSRVSVPPLVKLRMTSRQQRRLWQHVQSIDGFWESLQEIEPQIVARLAAVATDRRWEVVFFTKRPPSAGRTAQVQTQRWLEAKGFPLPSVYVVQGSRGRIAAALNLDIFVDDLLENCLDIVVDSKARAVLVWREGEKNLPAAARRLGVGVVSSVGECLDILTQVDSMPQGRPGIVERAMRLLGLKEPA